jgi:hypothetical protein
MPLLQAMIFYVASQGSYAAVFSLGWAEESHSRIRYNRACASK